MRALVLIEEPKSEESNVRYKEKLHKKKIHTSLEDSDAGDAMFIRISAGAANVWITVTKRRGNWPFVQRYMEIKM